MRSMILALCLAAPAHAQTACTGLPDALAALAARYAEAPRVSGLMANGQLLIVTASEAGEVRRPGGDGDRAGVAHAALPIRIVAPSPRWSKRCQAQLSLPVILLSGIHFTRPTETTLRNQGMKGAA